MDERAQIRFWRPNVPGVVKMLRLEDEDRARVTFSESFVVVVVYAGAFDGWYRGGIRRHEPGTLKLKEPGQVHRSVRVLAPYTIQGAVFSHDAIADAAEALGVRGQVRFVAPTFAPESRQAQLAVAMHAALTRPDASEIERETRVAETLAAVLGADEERPRSMRAVRLAREMMHDAFADKITLDGLAAHAGLDKFHLVRAFRAEVGLPPYEYLTYVRVARAKELLFGGALVADAAQAVGFYDESQLHRHFRRIIGITPGSFARSVKSQHRPSRARPAAAS